MYRLTLDLLSKYRTCFCYLVVLCENVNAYLCVQCDWMKSVIEHAALHESVCAETLEAVDTNNN